MDSSNFQRALRAFQRQSPFRPFTVALVNGDRFQVEHPEALIVREGVAVFFAADGEIRLFDHEGVSQFERESSGRRTGRWGDANPEG
jgi:hypothetical protein